MSETFSELFENGDEQQVKVGDIIPGSVVQIGREKVVINVGLKSEGFVDINQFKDINSNISIEEGDIVEVELESVDNGLGHTLISFEKAQHTKKWQELTLAMENKTIVTGIIGGNIKGGLAVSIGVVKAFLPGSLIDVRRPVSDFSYLEGQESEFIVIKMDKARNNIVVSRKAVLQEANAADREALIDSLELDGEVEGTVKNLVDYGAFVDLGGVDGLLHNSDIAWDRVNHPSEKLNIGDVLTLKVLSFDKEKMRVSLGLKQMTESPWNNLDSRMPVGTKVTGEVSNITDYGAFVKIEDGVEGLVHTSELDWSNENARASKLVKLGQKVDVVILGIDEKAHRIALSMKQAEENPWESFGATYAKGDKLNVVIHSITDFGLFAGLPGGIDGLIYVEDIAWNKPTSEEIANNYKKGQEIEVAVVNIDVKKERIALGIKQLSDDMFSIWAEEHKKGSIVKGTVAEVDARGALITLSEEVSGYLKVGEISEDKIEDASHVLNINDEVEATILRIDKKNRNILLSIKAKNTAEEKEAVANYNKQADENVATMGDLFKDVTK